MATCECGFNFVQAALDDREIESYAVVHDEDYQRVIDDELAIRSEADEERKLALIAEGSAWVGSLCVCPECGALALSKPQRSSTHGSQEIGGAGQSEGENEACRDGEHED